MGKIKMIVSDLDSTLLNSKKEISDYNLQVLRKKQSEGVYVVFATGRPYRVVDTFFGGFTPDFAIVHNGCVIYKDGNVFFHSGISPDDTQQCIEKIFGICGNDIPINIEIGEIIYRNCDMNADWVESTNIYTKDFKNIPIKPAEKIIIFPEAFDKVIDNLKDFPKSVYLQIFEGMVGALMSVHGTKLQSIVRTAEYLNIGLDEIVCFGDDHNDKEMLKSAGFGVAMENALPEVKACAKYITDTNDNDGVGKWIEAHSELF